MNRRDFFKASGILTVLLGALPFLKKKTFTTPTYQFEPYNYVVNSGKWEFVDYCGAPMYLDRILVQDERKIEDLLKVLKAEE